MTSSETQAELQAIVDLAAKPIALTASYSGEVVAWACAICRCVAQSEENARQHYPCVPLVCTFGCGLLVKRTGQRCCNPCWDKYEGEKGQALYDKASKVKASEYGDRPVLYGSSYCQSPEHALGQAEGGDQWAWGTTECRPVVDVESWLQDVEENMDVEDYEFDWNDVEGLREFVTEWTAKQSAHWFEVDYSVVVLLDVLTTEEPGHA